MVTNRQSSQVKTTLSAQFRLLTVMHSYSSYVNDIHRNY